MKSTKKLLILLFILLISIGGVLVSFKDVLFPNNTDTPIINNNDNVDVNQNDTDEYTVYTDEYDANYAINQDYVGMIEFASGLVDLPFVQGHDEDMLVAYDKYLRTDWKTMERDDEGSIFMDPQNTIDDQNVVLYGHYVYPHLDPSRTHKFTPLHELKEESNYETHKTIRIILEDEIRVYEVAHVYYAKINLDDPINPIETGMEYMYTAFNDDDLAYYLGRVKEIEFHNTGIEITPVDRFLTLQTCVENRDDLRLIVIAKEVEVIKTR